MALEKMALSTFIILDIHKYTFNILNKVKEHTSNYFKSSCMCSVRNSVIAKANVSPSASQNNFLKIFRRRQRKGFVICLGVHGKPD
jgi:hypothetical protein